MSQNDPTWTARLPADVKEYLKEKKGLSAGKCLIEYYHIKRKEELSEAEKELAKAKENVTHWETIVTQLKENVTQKQQIVTQRKHGKVYAKLKESFSPEFFIGKEIYGVKVTKEMVDEIKEASS